MKFAFVTCVELGLSCMDAIYRVGGTLDLAITLPDYKARTKSGRVYLDRFCETREIKLVKSSNVNDAEVIEAVSAAQIDWLFIIGWSQIARASLLSTPRRGVLGMHPTLLPEGRGRAAIPWAILKRLEKTGVTLFKLDDGVDTGDIIAQIEVPLSPETTATDLYRKVEDVHATLMQAAYSKLVDGSVEAVAQDHAKATEWPERKPEDGEIDLSRSVYEAECLVRAVTRPYPGAVVVRNGIREIIWQAQIGQAGQIPGPSDLCFPDGILHCLEREAVTSVVQAE